MRCPPAPCSTRRPRYPVLCCTACDTPASSHQHCAAPTPSALCSAHPCRGSAPTALRSARHPCSLPPPWHRASLPCTASPAPLLSPFIHRQNPRGQVLGGQAGPGHSLQHPLPAGEKGLPAQGSAVREITPSLPCPLRVGSRIAHTFPIIVGNSSKPSAQAWPLALWPGSWHLHCRSQSSANVKAEFAARSQHLLCLWKDSCGADTKCSISLIPLCSITTFSCYGETFMIYNEMNSEIVLLHGY